MIEKSGMAATTSYRDNVSVHCKKTNVRMKKEFLLHKDNKMRTAHAQNCTFASSDTQADASACKRAVFLPSSQKIRIFTSWWQFYGNLRTNK
jgi:hypothetical protein